MSKQGCGTDVIVGLEENADVGTWALGWWPRAADGLTGVAEWQRGGAGSLAEGPAREQRQKNEESETKRGRRREGDTGRDALDRGVQEHRKAGTQSMAKMQKAAGKSGDPDSGRDECGGQGRGRGSRTPPLAEGLWPVVIGWGKPFFFSSVAASRLLCLANNHTHVHTSNSNYVQGIKKKKRH